MNKFLLLLSLFPIVCFSQSKNTLSTEKKEFEVFNAILYKNAPDLSLFGLNKIFLFYEDELLDKHTSGNTINLTKIQKAAKSSYIDVNIPVCLDIESWDYSEVNKAKYTKVINYFKKYNNKSKVGYFGVFPMDSPHAEYSYKNEIRDKIIMPNWHEINERTKNIGMKVDVFFPVFYTRFKDRETWIKIVKEKVAKIKEINKTAKIYGFIWPQYYTDDGKYKFIEKDVWAEQLETLYQYCDGAVIWSHYIGPNGSPINFDYNMDWFITTIDFIKKYNIK